MKIDVRKQIFDLGQQDWGAALDIALLRCVSHTRALYLSRILTLQGVQVVNSHPTIALCGDKVLTSMKLQELGLPTPQTTVTFCQEEALAAAGKMGYPVVLKPAVGSWGRLIAKLNDQESAEAVLEHKAHLNRGEPFYIQNYVDKPGRDIRTLVVGQNTLYAVYRRSPHWITNTARGGTTVRCPITPEIDQMSKAAARAVGGEIVAVDLLETSEGRLLINEINHTPEFHGAVKALETDVAGSIVDHLLMDNTHQNTRLSQPKEHL